MCMDTEIGFMVPNRHCLGRWFRWTCLVTWVAFLFSGSFHKCATKHAGMWKVNNQVNHINWWKLILHQYAKLLKVSLIHPSKARSLSYSTRKEDKFWLDFYQEKAFLHSFFLPQNHNYRCRCSEVDTLRLVQVLNSDIFEYCYSSYFKARCEKGRI